MFRGAVLVALVSISDRFPRFCLGGGGGDPGGVLNAAWVSRVGLVPAARPVCFVC